MTRQRLKRRAMPIEERAHTVEVNKAITSAALDTGGKLYPASYPADLEALTGPRTPPTIEKPVEPPKLKLVEATPPPPPGDARSKKRKATVSHDRIDKLRDVTTYDPAVVSDAVLRDDFRILLGWHAKKARDDDFEHSFEVIEGALRKLIKEGVKRGPSAIQFDPKGMSSKVRPVFERLARALKVPKSSFKRLVLKADTEPGDLTTAELIEAHAMLHTIQVAKSRGAWGSEGVVNMHARVVDELGGRGIDHPPPPSDELDTTSAEFERGGVPEPPQEVVEKSEPRAVPVRLQKGAERSQASDSVVVGVYVYQPKPTAGPAQPEGKEPVTKSAGRGVEGMLELFDERPELFPTVIQKSSGGLRHQIHKTADGEVSIYSADGDDQTARLPGLVEEVKALKATDFVLDVELESWKGRERLSNQATVEYLAKVDDLDDTGIVASVVDVLHTDVGDVHTWPTMQRLRKMVDLDVYKAEHLSIAPAVKVSDLGQLERAVRMVGEFPGATGAIAKHVEAPYPLTKSADAWAECVVGKAQVQAKQADPFVEVPDESGTYRYVVQHHWKGKELHADFRVEFRSGKLLLGWRLQNQIAGVVKDPVTTLPEARAWRARFDELSKIDWGSGEWSSASVGAERMAPAPYLWLDVEGKTKDPENGKPPPVGGSSEFPGVFHIVDQGEVEHGAQKPWMHEYFVRGGAMRYRVVFRQLKLGELHKARHAHSKCMHCGTAKPTIDVLWADGRGRAWFCKKCYPEWLKSVGGPKGGELVGSKAIVGGRAPEYFGDVHKSVEVAKSADPHPVLKRLPPTELEKPMAGRWAMVQHNDATPYVLTADAVAKKWIPPIGVSALPKAVRDQVPKDQQYWLQRTAAKARKMRDGLVAAMVDGDITIDVDAPFVKLTKAAAPFVLQAQTWEGVTRKARHLRVDTGARDLLVLTMLDDPIEASKVLVKVAKDPRKGSLEASGKLKPGHYLNPTKAKSSTIEVIDKGSAEVLTISRDFIRMRVKGAKLKGAFAATRNEGGDWVWGPFDESQAKAEAELEKRADDIAGRKWFVPVQKIDKDKRLVTGIVLEPGEVDAQNDTITAEVIERASIKFLQGYNSSTQLGVMHRIFGDVGLELAHSWIALSNTKIGNKKVKKGSWLMTMRVNNDKLWKKVKSGELGGFSIGGLATVR